MDKKEAEKTEKRTDEDNVKEANETDKTNETEEDK